jgi:hypothetical protein
MHTNGHSYTEQVVDTTGAQCFRPLLESDPNPKGWLGATGLCWNLNLSFVAVEHAGVGELTLVRGCDSRTGVPWLHFERRTNCCEIVAFRRALHTAGNGSERSG